MHMGMQLLRDEDGQDLIEYAFLVAMIALAVAFAIDSVGASIRDVFNRMPTGAPPGGGGGAPGSAGG